MHVYYCIIVLKCFIFLDLIKINDIDRIFFRSSIKNINLHPNKIQKPLLIVKVSRIDCNFLIIFITQFINHISHIQFNVFLKQELKSHFFKKCHCKFTFVRKFNHLPVNLKLYSIFKSKNIGITHDRKTLLNRFDLQHLKTITSSHSHYFIDQ